MNPLVSSTVAGDLTTKWRRIAAVTEAVTEAVTIVQPVKVAMHLCELTNPRLLPTRCRLFRQSRVLVAVAAGAKEETGEAAVGTSNPSHSRIGHAQGTDGDAFALSTTLRTS